MARSFLCGPRVFLLSPDSQHQRDHRFRLRDETLPQACGKTLEVFCRSGPRLAPSPGGAWPAEEVGRKSIGVYLAQYVLRSVAALLALWKTGVLASIGTFWVGVGLLAILGIGIMIAVASSGRKESVEIDRG